MKKINCAVIGMGVGARHADFYSNYKYTNLVKIFEFDKKKWKNIKERYPNTKLVKSENEIFKDPNINLVSIASYDNYHYSQIIKATKFKKNVFVEKPICLFLNQLKEIKKKVAKSKINLSCNFVLREHSQFKKIKDIVKKKLGKVYYLEGDYNYGRLEKIEKGWRSKIPYYSVTHGGAIHIIDLVLWYLNELPYEIKSEGNKLITKKTKFKFNDFSIALLKFKSGKIVKISSNFGCVTPHHHAIKIYGEKGTLIQDFRGAILTESRDKKRKYKNFDLKTDYKKKSNVIKSFVYDLLSNKKKKLNINFDNIINSMLISLAIEESIKKNKNIKINFKKLDINE